MATTTTTTFRETMWFKLGEAQPEVERDGDEHEPSATMLPIEDRYAGQVTAEETRAFGLHTGTTEYLRVIDEVEGDDDASVAVLVRELKNRTRSFLALGAGAAAAVAMIALYLS